MVESSLIRCGAASISTCRFVGVRVFGRLAGIVAGLVGVTTIIGNGRYTACIAS
jgi:hypothetical protein